MTRAFFVVAALYDAAWFALLLLAPDRFLLKPLPNPAPMLGVLAGVTILCLFNAWKPRRPLVLLVLVAKCLGPLAWLGAVHEGYHSWSQWWMPLANDLAWIPPLAWIYRHPPAPRA